MELIVSLDAIQRRAQRAAAPGQCPHSPGHSAPRVRRAGRSPDSTTVLHVQRTRNSPASQCISSCDVRMTRAARPVAMSMFSLMAVRELQWKGAGVAGRVKESEREVFMSSVQLCCESAMTGSSFFSSASAPLQTPKNYGSLYETLL